MPAHPSITLANLHWSTPDGTPVLSGLDLQFARERTGLVGRNGVGKSTLLGLITGTLTPSAGHVRITGRIAMLHQMVQPAPGDQIADLFAARPALALLQRAEAGTASADDLAAADWTLEARIAEALAATGLPPLALDTPLAALSGGQRTRAALAAAMFSAPDFLLLDEPTNNLDREGRAAVHALLRGWRGGALVVSHDRELLEEMDAIVELTAQGARRYGGGWSAYRAQKQVEQAADEQALAEAEKQLAAVQRRTQAARERQARRDGGGRRMAAQKDMPRIWLGQQKRRAEESAGAAQRLAQRQQAEAADKLAEASGRIDHIDPLAVALPPTGLPASRRVLMLDQVGFGYEPDHPLFSDISLMIEGPERVALAGPNGSGKSTLLALAAGRLTPWRGSASIAVPYAFFDQSLSLLDPALSIADNFRALNPGTTNNQCRAALARFRFRAASADAHVGHLSGGQMLRAALACTLGAPTPPMLLLLDEPTNHLDLDSLAAVEEGLAAYDGALLIVSHDPHFLAAIGTDREIKLPPPAAP